MPIYRASPKIPSSKRSSICPVWPPISKTGSFSTVRKGAHRERQRAMATAASRAGARERVGKRRLSEPWRAARSRTAVKRRTQRRRQAKLGTQSRGRARKAGERAKPLRECERDCRQSAGDARSWHVQLGQSWANSAPFLSDFDVQNLDRFGQIGGNR